MLQLIVAGKLFIFSSVGFFTSSVVRQPRFCRRRRQKRGGLLVSASAVSERKAPGAKRSDPWPWYPYTWAFELLALIAHGAFSG
jgi:hypothetical protein